MLKYVITHLRALILLAIVQNLQYHLAADFLHTQIFNFNLPNVVPVYVQLICNQSDSKLMIPAHHLPDTLNIGFSLVH